MRKRAERQIRQAAERLGSSGRYRVDRVRAGAGLIRKVYDKTLLDMARVGTIELSDGDTSDLTGAEIGNMIVSGGMRYVWFRFLESVESVEPEAPATVDIEIRGMDRDAWQLFAYYCATREKMEPMEKLVELVREFNRRNRGETGGS